MHCEICLLHLLSPRPDARAMWGYCGQRKRERGSTATGLTAYGRGLFSDCDYDIRELSLVMPRLASCRVVSYRCSVRLRVRFALSHYNTFTARWASQPRSSIGVQHLARSSPAYKSRQPRASSSSSLRTEFKNRESTPFLPSAAFLACCNGSQGRCRRCKVCKPSRLVCVRVPRCVYVYVPWCVCWCARFDTIFHLSLNFLTA